MNFTGVSFDFSDLIECPPSLAPTMSPTMGRYETCGIRPLVDYCRGGRIPHVAKIFFGGRFCSGLIGAYER